MAGVRGNAPGMGPRKLSGLFLLIAISATTCVKVPPITAPAPVSPPPPVVTPPPTPPPPPIATPPPPKVFPPPAIRETPPPVLSPHLGQAEEERQRQEVNGKIQKAEQSIQRVDQGKLGKDQQETYATIRNFIGNAKEALSAQDFLRASNLAEKAQLLAEDLLRTFR